MTLSRNRIESERAFHNARFSEETREKQGKYYASIKHGSYAFERRVRELARGADVLEYGCGAAIQGLGLSRQAKTLTGIDISDVAIDKARAAANDLGLTNTHYATMDAEDMTFPPGSFDLVFGRGIIHHLDLKRCFASISSVLRPGGIALFFEPLGHNPVLNRYRELTPNSRTPDEHPLLKPDFELAKQYFDISLSFYGLSTIVTVPIRDTWVGDKLLRITAKVDDILFRTPMRWLAWHCVLELRKRPALAQ